MWSVSAVYLCTADCSQVVVTLTLNTGVLVEQLELTDTGTVAFGLYLHYHIYNAYTYHLEDFLCATSDSKECTRGLLEVTGNITWLTD